MLIAGITMPVGGWRSAAEAAVVLAVGMGFGRFAFTAIFPYMVAEGVITLQQGSWAASANYAGYLVGALCALGLKASQAHRWCVAAVLGTAGCLAVLAAPLSVWGIVVVRGIAGALSAVAIVAASLWLLERRANAVGAPLLYAGVGVGIALSAELLVLSAHAGLSSAGMWLVLGAVALVLGVIAVQGMFMHDDVLHEPTGAATVQSSPLVAATPMVAIYGLAGLGYIVTATYLPVLVHSALPDVDAAHIWALFGVGAAPSCFVWHRIHDRVGTRVALQWNVAVQAVGVMLPALWESTASYMLSALLVGGTFMGTVTIVMPAAQRLARHSGRNFVAIMTLVYGVGQILGPVLAEVLHRYSHNFAGALWLAAAALLLAFLLSLWVYAAPQRAA